MNIGVRMNKKLNIVSTVLAFCLILLFAVDRVKSSMAVAQKEIEVEQYREMMYIGAAVRGTQVWEKESQQVDRIRWVLWVPSMG